MILILVQVFADGNAGQAYTTNVQTTNGGGSCTLSIAEISPMINGAVLTPSNNIQKTTESTAVFGATPQTAGMYDVKISAVCPPLSPSGPTREFHRTFKWKVVGLGGGTAHSNGSLIINIPGEHNPTGVYLVENGKRRPFPTTDIFACLGYDINNIVPANTEDASLPVGDVMACTAHSNGSLIVNVPGEHNPTGVYLVENGKRRPFATAEIFICLNYKWSDIVPANTEDAKLPLGAGMACTTTVGGGGTGGGGHGGGSGGGSAKVCTTYKDQLEPIYRYWGRSGSDHFFTTNANEIPQNYINEGIAGYIFKNSSNRVSTNI